MWERGVDAGPGERGTLLLSAAHPGIESASWHHASLGTRNAALLDLRVRLFGPDLDGVAECPACDETIEIGLPLPRLEWPAPAATLSVTAAGYDIEARLPTIADVAELPAEMEAAALTLLDRCVVGARRAGEEVAAASLPPAVVDAVSTAMANADPHGVIELVVACPACDERSAVVLDPAAYLWSELHRWAIRTLHEIHALATAYGWSEADVLALSPTRRQAYLQLVAA